MRQMKRRELESRNRIWKQSADRVQARIEDIDAEKVELLQKLEIIAFVKEEYNIENAVLVSREEDEEAMMKAYEMEQHEFAK